MELADVRGHVACPVGLSDGPAGGLCGRGAVAAWGAQPIVFGPGWRGVPLVLGPDQVPVLTEAGQAAGVPELAVLSALAHGGNPDHLGVLDALAEALAFADEGRAVLYAELVLAALPEAAREHLEALMKTEKYRFQSHYACELRAQGKAEGVLTVLDARDIEVPDGVRTHIAGCSDADQLDRWSRRAATAGSVDELFD